MSAGREVYSEGRVLHDIARSSATITSVWALREARIRLMCRLLDGIDGEPCLPCMAWFFSSASLILLSEGLILLEMTSSADMFATGRADPGQW